MISRQWRFQCRFCKASVFIHPRKCTNGLALIPIEIAQEEAHELGWHSDQCELCREAVSA